MPTVIHPTAIVEPGAQLGADCVIHPYAIVKQWATLGDRVTVHPFAVVGGDPQDLKFRGTTRSFVRIGSDTRIREGVTVNRATEEGAWTVVGANCLLMATAHVAHECVVGDDVVVANAVLLAGHVHIGDHAILGGNALIHQFCRVGERRDARRRGPRHDGFSPLLPRHRARPADRAESDRPEAQRGRARRRSAN